MPTIKLKSSDNEIFEVETETAKCLGTIKTMIEDCGLEENGDLAIIPLPKVNSKVLVKILCWADKHKYDAIPAADNGAKDISPWDSNFLKVDQSTLFEIILAANYLDIKGLMDVACQTVANLMKGKSPEQIRIIFNMKSHNFSAEKLQEKIAYEE